VINPEKNEMGGACSVYGGRRVAYRVLVGKEGKRLLGRPSRGWEDNINILRKCITLISL
jgi:hypothetical protein